MNNPANISKYLKDKKVTVSSQHGFMKGKSCLTNLIVLYNEMMSSIDEVRAMGDVYLVFREAFDTVPITSPPTNL